MKKGRDRKLSSEYYSSPSVISLSIWARYLFPALWIHADDNGIFEWSPIKIKIKCLPGDDLSQDDVRGFLDEMIEAGLVARFDAQWDGKQSEFGLVVGFHRHQAPRKPACVYPLPKSEMLDSLGLDPEKYRTSTVPVPDQSGTTPDSKSKSKSKSKRERESKRESERESESGQARDDAPVPPGGDSPAAGCCSLSLSPAAIEKRSEVIRLLGGSKHTRNVDNSLESLKPEVHEEFLDALEYTLLHGDHKLTSTLRRYPDSLESEDRVTQMLREYGEHLEEATIAADRRKAEITGTLNAAWRCAFGLMATPPQEITDRAVRGESIETLIAESSPDARKTAL